MFKDTPVLKKVKKLFETKFLKFYSATYQTEAGENDYYFVSRSDEKGLSMLNKDKKKYIKGNAIEAFTYIKENDGYKILMIKEFRRPLNEYVFSFPAGIIEKKDKTLLDAYIREIEEELGGSIKNIEYCQKNPMPLCAGVTDESNYYAIVEIKELHFQKLEEQERIEVYKFTVQELEQKIKNSELPLTVQGYLGAVLLINKLKEMQ